VKARTHNRFFLVACASKKRTEPCPARDLYRSAWFRAARRYVETTGKPWFILSALHGLVRPDARIAPYDVTLADSIMPERLLWTERVVADLMLAARPGDRIDILAGARYREFLVPALAARRIDVFVPMRSLGIGEQLRWLNGQAEMSERLRWLNANPPPLEEPAWKSAIG
jgi:hypothetical protein